MKFFKARAGKILLVKKHRVIQRCVFIASWIVSWKIIVLRVVWKGYSHNPYTLTVSTNTTKLCKILSTFTSTKMKLDSLRANLLTSILTLIAENNLCVTLPAFVICCCSHYWRLVRHLWSALVSFVHCLIGRCKLSQERRVACWKLLLNVKAHKATCATVPTVFNRKFDHWDQIWSKR